MKKKIPTYRTPSNYHLHPRVYEKNDDPSMTIPGESYSIRELLEKQTQGIMPPIHRQQIYDENPTFDTDTTVHNPDYDLTDKENLLIEKKAQLELLIKEQKQKKDQGSSKTRELNSGSTKKDNDRTTTEGKDEGKKSEKTEPEDNSE